MLNLSVRPGEYLMVGENVKIVFVGGTGNNIHLMIEAPREVNIVRSAVAEKAGAVPPSPYKKKTPVSDAAQQEIIRIIREDKKKAGAAGSSK